MTIVQEINDRLPVGWCPVWPSSMEVQLQWCTLHAAGSRHRMVGAEYQACSQLETASSISDTRYHIKLKHTSTFRVISCFPPTANFCLSCSVLSLQKLVEFIELHGFQDFFNTNNYNRYYNEHGFQDFFNTNNYNRYYNELSYFSWTWTGAGELDAVITMYDIMML